MKRALLLNLILTLFISCCEVEMERFDYATFKHERDTWEATKPESFEYIYHIHCANHSYLVQHSDGKYKITYDNWDCSDDTYMTIEEIYKDVEATYKEYNHKVLDICDNQIIDIEIKYDKTNHIPTYVYYELYNGKEILGHAPISITDFKITE